MTYAYLDSPFGMLKIITTSSAVRGIEFVGEKGDTDADLPNVMMACIDQLNDYFEHKREKFDLPLDFGDAPQFYIEVWNMLCAIPYGKTRSYSNVAKVIARPSASRAVGQAIGKNPLAIVVPCHRVIGKRGALRGYAYGIDVKRQLLHFENPSHYPTQKQLFVSVLKSSMT